MRRRLMMVLGLLVMGALQAGEWQRRGPDGAQALDVARAGSRLLLGTTDGLYASSDDGSSWTRVVSIPLSQAVYRIVANPHDANHWYIVVRETYLDPGNPYPVQSRYLERETRNGGLSWQSPAFDIRYNSSRLPVFHPAANRVIASWSSTAPAYGWQFSADGGFTWNVHASDGYGIPVGLPLPGNPFASMTISEQDFTTMSFRLGSADGSSFSAPLATLNIPHAHAYHELMPRAAASQAFWIAGTNYRPTYVGSIDFLSGQLVQFPNYDGEARQVFDDPASPGTVLLVMAGADTSYEQRLFGVSALAASGTQWSLRGGVEQSVKSFYPIETWPKALLDGPSLWLTDAGVGVHRSVDGGATWQVRNSGLQAAAVNAVLLDPRNPDRLLAGRDMQSLQRSVDAGLHWSDVGGSVPQDVRALARSPVDPDHVLATARGGLYRSRDAGQTWHVVPTAIDPVAGAAGWNQIVWCANTDTHLLGTVGRKLYRSLDGGTSWSFVHENLTGASFGLRTATRAPQSVYITGLWSENGPRVLRTDDCGMNVEAIPLTGGSASTLAVSPYDSRLIAMGRRPSANSNDDQVALSSDGGTTWAFTDLLASNSTGLMNPLGWFRGCDTTVFTTTAFKRTNGFQPEPLPETPALSNNLARVRTADSHCIDGDSVEVIGTHDGIWLHRTESLIFANGFEQP